MHHLKYCGKGNNSSKLDNEIDQKIEAFIEYLIEQDLIKNKSLNYRPHIYQSVSASYPDYCHVCLFNKISKKHLGGAENESSTNIK